MHFHISFFAIALGLAGTALAFQKAEQFFTLPGAISNALIIVTLVVFTIVAILYLAKLIRYPAAVAEEFRSPVKINFFPLIAKILLVVSVFYLEKDMRVSKYFWIAGTLLQLLASIIILSMWIHNTDVAMIHMTPAWFIPIVGSIIVPIAGVKHAPLFVSWFFFSAGLVLFGVLFTIVFNRLLFHSPIQEKLVPTLFILFAPPAIGFISYYKLTGEVDAFANVLYFLSLFLFILVIAQVRLFIRIRFFLSWWAYTFPLAAFTIATSVMYAHGTVAPLRYVALGTLALLGGIILLLTVRTGIGIARKELCLEE